MHKCLWSFLIWNLGLFSVFESSERGSELKFECKWLTSVWLVLKIFVFPCWSLVTVKQTFQIAYFPDSKLQAEMKCLVAYWKLWLFSMLSCSNFPSWIFVSGYAVASSSDDRMNEPPTSLGLVPHQVRNLWENDFI